MLFLRANHPFRGQLKPSNPLGIERGLPTPMGVVARGARILPPPPLHPPFKQPPPKIMRRIFTEALDSRRSEFWRPSLVAFGRVCKAWVQALEMLYEDFSQYAGGQKAPNMIDVAAALRLNPSRGHAIRRFSPFHFRRRREEQTYAEESLALVDILSTADLVDDLVVKDVFVGHKDRSIQALRGCAAVKMFMVNRGPPKPEEEPETYVLSLADIISCLSRWRQLRVLKVYGFSASVVLDEGGPEPICELKQLHLQGGRANDLDLLRLTSSSFSSLERVDFRDLTGITNAGLTEWLMAMAHTLTWLTFDNCTFPKESWNEHAIDAAISDMEKLRRLDLCGNVCSELVFKRKERKPTPAGICRSSYHISLSNVPVETFTRDFPNVLRETGWDDITMWNALKHDAELRNAAKKVAEEQGIRLRV